MPSASKNIWLVLCAPRTSEDPCSSIPATIILGEHIRNVADKRTIRAISWACYLSRPLGFTGCVVGNLQAGDGQVEHLGELLSKF
jgi:hypothetical protein